MTPAHLALRRACQKTRFEMVAAGDFVIAERTAKENDSYM